MIPTAFCCSIFLQARQREQDFVDDLVLCMRHKVRIRCGKYDILSCWQLYGSASSRALWPDIGVQVIARGV